MKTAIILSLCIVAAIAAPQRPAAGNYGGVETKEYKSDNPGDGNYNFAYTLSDGTSRSEQGQLKQIGQEYGQAITGTITYTSPEGEQITLNYVADENGFQPQGAHLPKPARR